MNLCRRKKFIFNDAATSLENRPNNKRLQPMGEKKDEIVAYYQREIV